MIWLRKRRYHLIIGRILLWLKIFRCFKGLDINSQLNLLISSIFDLFLTLFTIPSNPILLSSGIYFVKPLNVVIYVRGKTEDLYYFLPRREGPVNDFIGSTLQPGNIFVDVGANIGYYTIMGH